MTKRPKTAEAIPPWVLWIAEHGFVAAVAIGLCGMLAVAAVSYWLDSRIERLEDRISQKPPKSYSPPNLDLYQAPEIAPEQIVAEHLVYVPMYSHVYFSGGRPFLLEATLSLRNPSPVAPAYVRSVHYYDTEGALIKEPLKDRLIMLKPLQTLEFVIAERDSSGGSGANFLVDWVETDASVEPLVEVVMVGAAGAQGISFRAVGMEVPRPNDRDPGER